MNASGLNGPESGLGAQRLDGRSASIDYGTGRTCGDCDAQLSRYNPHDFCRACVQFHPVRIRPDESTLPGARSRQKLRALDKASK